MSFPRETERSTITAACYDTEEPTAEELEEIMEIMAKEAMDKANYESKMKHIDFTAACYDTREPTAEELEQIMAVAASEKLKS
jgi:arsenate reductase-like glutaredoxin family protein